MQDIVFSDDDEIIISFTLGLIVTTFMFYTFKDSYSIWWKILAFVILHNSYRLMFCVGGLSVLYLMFR